MPRMAKGSRRPQLNLYRRERCHQMETFEEDILGGWSGMNRNVDSYSVKCICICVHAKLLQSCPTLCDPRDCSPPGSSVHRILHARILERVAMPSSRGSFQTRDWIHVSCGSVLQADSLPLSHHGSPEMYSWNGSSAVLQSSIYCIGRHKIDNVGITLFETSNMNPRSLDLRDNGNPLNLFEKRNAAQSTYWISICRKNEWMHKNILRRVIVWGRLNLQKNNIGLVRKTEKALVTHSSTLAWKIPWTEEPGRLQSMVLLRIWHDWATSLSLFTFMHWRRKWQPTPVFLPGESQGRGSLVGCRLWGRSELDTTEVT